MRIIFMGTPDFAVPTLGEIVGAGHEVVAVYTQPPRPAGRGMKERPSPVQTFAEACGLKVLTSHVPEINRKCLRNSPPSKRMRRWWSPMG